jgi:hypothetical protein
MERYTQENRHLTLGDYPGGIMIVPQGAVYTQ